MKKFNIWVSTEKSDYQGRSSQKANIDGGIALKGGGGAWTVCKFKGGLDKKEGGVFEGVDTPMHTMSQKCPKK